MHQLQELTTKARFECADTGKRMILHAFGRNPPEIVDMIAALQRLQSSYGHSHLPEQVKAFGITPGKGGISRLFMSHPPLEERIAALRQARA